MHDLTALVHCFQPVSDRTILQGDAKKRARRSYSIGPLQRCHDEAPRGTGRLCLSQMAGPSTCFATDKLASVVMTAETMKMARLMAENPIAPYAKGKIPLQSPLRAHA